MINLIMEGGLRPKYRLTKPRDNFRIGAYWVLLG